MFESCWMGNISNKTKNWWCFLLWDHWNWCTYHYPRGFTSKPIQTEFWFGTRVEKLPLYVMALSATSNLALDKRSQLFTSFLEDEQDTNLDNITYSANASRAHHQYRKVALGGNKKQPISYLHQQSQTNYKYRATKSWKLRRVHIPPFLRCS